MKYVYLYRGGPRGEVGGGGGRPPPTTLAPMPPRLPHALVAWRIQYTIFDSVVSQSMLYYVSHSILVILVMLQYVIQGNQGYGFHLFYESC